MASKQPRFTRKVYKCWVLEYCGPAEVVGDYSPPLLFATKRGAINESCSDERPIPVRVTVERIERKTKGKS